MYIWSFFKNFFKKENIGIAIWLVLNAALITFIIGSMLAYLEVMNYTLCYVTGFTAYLLSLVIALSPAGEFILRVQNNCRKIKNPEYLSRLEPLFNDVYIKAKALSTDINDNVQLYFCPDKSVNAFATGRKTICVTEGLMSLSDEEIKAVFAHEFGHLAMKDTDLILLITVGNFIVTGMILLAKIIIKIIALFFAGIFSLFLKRFGAFVMGFITNLLVNAFIAVFMWIWTEIGILFCMFSMRSSEYTADEFAYNLNYGSTLCNVLYKIGGHESRGLWAALNSSHPSNEKRIAKLQELMGY